jgi:prepilin peptidase CpaA
MVTTALLLVLLAVATATDIRWRKIYNANVYPGILLAWALNGLATLCGVDAVRGTVEDAAKYGLVGLPDSVFGFALCGAVMLVCYVFFAGGIGGGDVKLIAMMGAFLGVQQGLEAMLWAFVLGGASALIVLVWKLGLVTLVKRGAKYVLLALRLGKHAVPEEEDRGMLKSPLFLAPSAMLAVVIVRFSLIEWF